MEENHRTKIGATVHGMDKKEIEKMVEDLKSLAEKDEE
jgi:molecular chaperone DnaK (HSP70)